MSEYVYRVHYDRPITSPATTITTHTELQERIRKLLRELGATPLATRQSASTNQLEAVRLDSEQGILNLPEDMTEIPVPDILTGPSVQNETLLLKAVNEAELLVTVTDASLQTTQCDQIVLDLARKLYSKATGEKATDEEITIERIGVLAHAICHHCRTQVPGLPYKCPHCGRTFCRSHVAPVNHQCAVTAGQVTEAHIPKPSVSHQSESKPDSKTVRPRITIGRVPCG